MRARYAAYATVDVDYLFESSCGPARKDFDRKMVRQWAENSEWLGLEILATEKGGDEDTEGTVEFIARYKTKEAELTHHELATFHRVDGLWRFYDGKVIGPEPVRREEPKIGRNDPCPCGSGKKYKKCCGKNS